MADEEDEQIKKKGNALPTWGNAQTMNINNLIVTNILSSPYFKNDLFKLKTFHEVIDEIYYKVDHLEPWERGSRKTHGQVGMCGGVRGVGAGGIVSSGYCLLFKLFTMKLTKKQVYVLLNHSDSPYIRALGFMYIRYCLHPNTFWEWFEPYLEDDEEVDPKAGSGCAMTMGQMVRSFLLKIDWYGTLFPRIPVPIHKEIEAYLKEYNLCDDRKVYANEDEVKEKERPSDENGGDSSFGEAEKYARRKREEKDQSPRQHSSDRDRHRDSDRHRRRDSDRDRHRSSRDRDSRSSSRRRSRSRERSHRDKKHDRDRHNKDHSRDRNRSREKDDRSHRHHSKER